MEKYHDDPAVHAIFNSVQNQVDKSVAKVTESMLFTEGSINELELIKDKIAELEFTLSVYRDAMRTSMEEVSKVDTSFKEIYDKHNLMLADLQLSLVAAREVCFDLGGKLGLEVNTIKDLMLQKKSEVFTNNLNIIHGNNIPKNVVKHRGVLEEKIKLALESKKEEISNYFNDKIFLGKVRVVDSYHKLLDLWLEDSSKGIIESDFNIGISFYKGIGIGQNIESAIHFFKRASAGGVANASYYLYQIYSNYLLSFYNDSLATKYYDLAYSQKSSLLISNKNKDNLKHVNKIKQNLIKGKSENDLFEFVSIINSDSDRVEIQKSLTEAVNRRYSWSKLANILHSIKFDLQFRSDKLFFSKSRNYYLHIYNKLEEEITFEYSALLSNGTTISGKVLLNKSENITINLVSKLPNELTISSIDFFDVNPLLGGKRFALKFDLKS